MPHKATANLRADPPPLIGEPDAPGQADQVLIDEIKAEMATMPGKIEAHMPNRSNS